MPAASKVKRWYLQTPKDFLSAAKVPQVITHEKVQLDCDDDWKQFLAAMDNLQEKLGPLLLQFGYFNRTAFKSGGEFLARLIPFLKKLPKEHKFAVEIRNRNWLVPKFADVLREHGVALTLIDQGWMPRPWEIKERFDLITSDFTYVRWLGDRKGIEEKTRTWDWVIVHRRVELVEWVEICPKIQKRRIQMFVYANNHYAGHAPATVEMFRRLWEAKEAAEPRKPRRAQEERKLFN